MPRQNRAQEFGRRHPRLTFAITSLAVAGVLANCLTQISDGTYLRGWLISSVAGMATAVALSATALIRNVGHEPKLGSFEWALVLLAVPSVMSIIPYPFLVGSTFVDILHAALLGYAAVTLVALEALLIYVIVTYPSRAAPRQLSVRTAGRPEIPDSASPFAAPQMRTAHGWPTWLLGSAAGGLVAGVILAVVSNRTSNTATTAAGLLILLALAAVCVAVPAALYRRHRRKVEQLLRQPDTSTAAAPLTRD
jgi:hypothetical protein